MRRILIVAALWGGFAAAAAAQAPGLSETGNGGIAPDLGSGVRGGMSTATDAMSKPGGPSYGIPGNSRPSPGTATSDGNFGTGMGGAGMRPVAPGPRD